MSVGKSKYVDFLVYFIGFIFDLKSNFARKSQAVIGCPVGNWGTLLCLGLLFFGGNSAKVGFPI